MDRYTRTALSVGLLTMIGLAAAANDIRNGYGKATSNAPAPIDRPLDSQEPEVPPAPVASPVQAPAPAEVPVVPQTSSAAGTAGSIIEATPEAPPTAAAPILQEHKPVEAPAPFTNRGEQPAWQAPFARSFSMGQANNGCTSGCGDPNCADCGTSNACDCVTGCDPCEPGKPEGWFGRFRSWRDGYRSRRTERLASRRERRGMFRPVDAGIYPPQQPQHQMYQTDEWFYYRRPYNHQHVTEHQTNSAPLAQVADPVNPYSNRFFREIYERHGDQFQLDSAEPLIKEPIPDLRDREPSPQDSQFLPPEPERAARIEVYNGAMKAQAGVRRISATKTWDLEQEKQVPKRTIVHQHRTRSFEHARPMPRVIPNGSFGVWSGQ